MENTIYLTSEGRIEEIEISSDFNNQSSNKEIKSELQNSEQTPTPQPYMFEGGMRFI